MASLEHYHTQFEEGKFYHVYNRSVNGQIIFLNDWHCEYFFKQYDKYISPVAETYAYCILGNHFHLMIHVRPYADLLAHADSSSQPWQLRSQSRRISTHDIVSHQFRKLFQSYAKTFNMVHNRVGSVFQNPFKRGLVYDNNYLTQLVYYIHANPQKHGLIDDFRKWKRSSYNNILDNQFKFLQRQKMIDQFGGIAGYEAFHLKNFNITKGNSLFLED